MHTDHKILEVHEFYITCILALFSTLHNVSYTDIEQSSGSSENNNKQHDGGRRMHWTVVVLVSALVLSVLIVGLAAAYKFWQKKKREHEQARFLRLFEEGDDIEDELGIGPLGGSV